MKCRMRMRCRIISYFSCIILLLGLLASLIPEAKVYAAEVDLEAEASESPEVEVEEESAIGEAISCSENEESDEVQGYAEIAPVAAGSSTDFDYTQAYQVLDIVNQERAKAGLSPLTMDQDLLNAAMLRAQEITVSFSHTRPDGTICFTASNKMKGENIAYGYSSPSKVMDAWMNSSGHRANIMNSGYKSIGIGCYKYGGRLYWTQCFGYATATPVKTNEVLIPKGISVLENSKSIIKLRFDTIASDQSKVEYKWIACNEKDKQWFLISNWSVNNEELKWIPANSGDYIIVGQARIVGDANSQVEASVGVNHHKAIKGTCQMPYTGQGGGYLIGLETYDNPNQEYRYEMLILDCTLLAQGKDAWIYTTGKCLVPENCFWTIWQPKYGYYWTLFRVYNKNGALVDEVVYGFVNAY